MGLRFTAKMVERLCDSLRRQVEEVRSIEKQIYEIMVNKCGMPRPHFLKSFPGAETNQRWVAREPRRTSVLGSAGAKPAGGAGTAGKALGPAEAHRAAAEGPAARSTNKWHRRGQGAQGQARDDRGQPAPGDLDRQEVPPIAACSSSISFRKATFA